MRQHNNAKVYTSTSLLFINDDKLSTIQRRASRVAMTTVTSLLDDVSDERQMTADELRLTGSRGTRVT